MPTFDGLPLSAYRIPTDPITPAAPGPRHRNAAERAVARAAEAYTILRAADPRLPPLHPGAAAGLDGFDPDRLPRQRGGPHRHSQDGKTVWRVVPKQFWGRLVTALERFEHLTRTKGKQGALKQSGVNLYRGMVHGFLNPRTGQCDPSWETLATRSNLSRSSVGEAIKRLERFGLIEHTRRVVPRKITFMGRALGWTWEQTSNAYRLGNGNADAMAQAVPTEALPLWQQWLRGWEALVREIAGVLRPSESKSRIESTKPLISKKASDQPGPLGAALGRLGEAIRRSMEGIAPSDAYGEPPKAAHF